MDLEKHSAALREAGSYEVEARARFSGFDEENVNWTFITKVAFDPREGFQVWTIDREEETINYEIYRPPGSEVNYICIRQDVKCLEKRNISDAGGRFTFRNFTAPLAPLRIREIERFSDKGVTTTKEGQRHKYVATDEMITLPNPRYKNARLEIYINPRTSLVTRVNYTYNIARNEGPPATVRWDYSYRYGVDVSPPGWYDGSESATTTAEP